MDSKERERLIGRYADGSGRLREALAKAPERMRKWRPGPGEFSVHEVIVHCADSETNSHSRIRYLMTEDNATIIGYDTDVWAAAFDYQNHPLDAAMLTVEAVRANTVPILSRAPNSAWARAGTHTESGPYSAEDWLRIYAAHCHDHADQIEQVIEAWTASQA
ncbi:MAG: DinB family protein [Chloroflexota bacterium]|nr:DinB family protein [Chloroflexota bacterium]